MWTRHTRYQFHAENNNCYTSEELAHAIEGSCGLPVMVSEYVDVCWGATTEGRLIVWIAPCDLSEEQEQGLYELLEDTICGLTSNTCLTPTREQVEVNCRCE